MTHIFKDFYGHPQTLREKYLSNLNPFNIVPECGQAISATVTLVCKDENGEEWILLAERSQRKMLATGHKFFVLSINETPKRKPTDEELKFLEDVPSEKINPDPLGLGGLFFHAVVRGAYEELGISLPIETIRFFCLNMEPKRYQFGLVGMAYTNLEKRYVNTCLLNAKDRWLEYKNQFWVRFIPECVYYFMITHEPWGSEAEIGLYQALLNRFKNDPDRIKMLFKDYPNPLAKIPDGIFVEQIAF